MGISEYTTTVINEDSNDGLGSHSWNMNISSTIIIAECEIAGYYVILMDNCHILVSPRNVTCNSNNSGIINYYNIIIGTWAYFTYV